MANQLLISIVIPTYNSADSLYFAIQSVLNQTYKNIELIVVDDGSTDSTYDLLNSNNLVNFSTKQKINFKYYRSYRNSGSPVYPRNHGVQKAEGKYLAFLDADDIWKPNKLEVQLFFMHMTGAVLSYHDLKVVNGNKEYNWSEMSTCHSGYVFETLLRKNFIPTSSVMMKKKYYYEMDKKYKVSHDLDLWLRIAWENNIEFLNEVLGTLDIHDGSVITSNHRRRKETRHIVRKYKNRIPEAYYDKIMTYYYLMEIFDLLPKSLKSLIRRVWYGRKKYNRGR